MEQLKAILCKADGRSVIEMTKDGILQFTSDEVGNKKYQVHVYSEKKIQRFDNVIDLKSGLVTLAWDSENSYSENKYKKLVATSDTLIGYLTRKGGGLVQKTVLLESIFLADFMEKYNQTDFALDVEFDGEYFNTKSGPTDEIKAFVERSIKNEFFLVPESEREFGLKLFKHCDGRIGVYTYMGNDYNKLRGQTLNEEQEETLLNILIERKKWKERQN